MKTIYEFKKGDEIVRIVPAKPLNNIRDRSYMGNGIYEQLDIHILANYSGGLSDPSFIFLIVVLFWGGM